MMQKKMKLSGSKNTIAIALQNTILFGITLSLISAADRRINAKAVGTSTHQDYSLP